MDSTPLHLAANVARFNGFADVYDAHRPQPPLVILDILTQIAQIERPRLVVDLGCGTGISTRLWADRADAIIGIEPNDEMRAQAEARGVPPNVRYTAGYSHATGLPDGCADIVTCSQSLHWMEPTSTFAEIARILRPEGVFAAFDCDWPPTINPAAERVDMAFQAQAQKIGEASGWYHGVVKWKKHEHLARMEASGKFRFVKELTVHSIEPGDADRLVGLALSQGGVAALLEHGMTEAEIGVPEFRAQAKRALGQGTVPWYFSYRIRVGIK